MEFYVDHFSQINHVSVTCRLTCGYTPNLGTEVTIIKGIATGQTEGHRHMVVL